MTHTRPEAFPTRELLGFVRDRRPTVAEFTARFGGPGDQVLQVLRKHGAVVEDGRVRLSRRHLSPDGRRFVWDIRSIRLDDGVVEAIRRGPEGPPAWSDDARPRVAAVLHPRGPGGTPAAASPPDSRR